eukprot:scaffold123531_cov66-Phaeocystis_antarctica.AAC.2
MGSCSATALGGGSPSRRVTASANTLRAARRLHHTAGGVAAAHRPSSLALMRSQRNRRLSAASRGWDRSYSSCAASARTSASLMRTNSTIAARSR